MPDVCVVGSKPRAPCILGKRSTISRQLLSANVCFVSFLFFPSFLPYPPWQLSPELDCFFQRGLTKETASFYKRTKCFSQILQLSLKSRKEDGVQKRLTFLSLSHSTTTVEEPLTIARHAKGWRFSCELRPKAPSGSSVSEDFKVWLSSQETACSWTRRSPQAKQGLKCWGQGQ